MEKSGIKKLRLSGIFGGVLLSILLTVALLALGIFLVRSDESYYVDKFRKNRIPAVTGKSIKELVNIGDDLIRYMNTGEGKLIRRHFNYREVLHMEDVYRLMKFNDQFGLLSGFSFLIGFLLMKRKFLFVELLIGHLLFFVGLLVFGFFIGSSFSRWFFIFHELFFNNDLWLLDPKTDLMIQMLPENFFQGMVKNIGIIVAGGLIMYSIFLAMGKAGYFGKDCISGGLFEKRR